jgi:cytochrome P450
MRTYSACGKSLNCPAPVIRRQLAFRDKLQHAARRKLQRQPYSQQTVLENEQLIARCAEDLVQRMMPGSPEGGSHCVVDVFPFCGLFSLEIVCQVAFNKGWDNGSETGALRLLEAMDGSAMLLLIDAALPFLKKYGLGKHVPGPIGDPFRHFDNWTQMTRKLLRDFGEDDVSKDRSHRFMATPLLLNEDAFLGRTLTEDEAVEEAMGIAFAGSGTTSTTLAYLFYNLSLPENAYHQRRLREELYNAGESLNELQQLPFLNAVIKETMRLNPTIISTLPRTLDTELSIPKLGFSLPKGTTVGMQNYVHHRDPEIFTDAESFNPERWLGDCEAAERTITPFSLGQRNCIGQNLARAELYMAVSKVFRRLSVKLSSKMARDDMEMQDRFNVAPRGKKLWLDVEVAK